MSGADLEYQRMLRIANIESEDQKGYDAARLEQINDQTVSLTTGNIQSELLAIDANKDSGLRMQQDSRLIVKNVKNFGALGNGVNDDAAAINAAITAVNGAGGGDVLIPRSSDSYMLSTSIIMKANVRLILEGNLKMAPSATLRAIIATNINGVVVEGRPGGGIIDMNKTATTRGGSNVNQQAILANYTDGAAYTGLTITGLTVKNGWWRGIVVTATGAGSSISNVTIERNSILTTEETGIVVGLLGNTDKVSRSNSQNVFIRRNIITFSAGISANGHNGIMCYGCSQVVVAENILYGSGVATGQGITLGTTGTGLQATDFLIDNNTVTGFTTVPKWGIVATVNSTRFNITRNYVDDCSGGITVDPEDGGAVGVEVVARGSVTGNTTLNSLASHGLNVRMCNSIEVLNNKSSGNWLAGIAVTAATGVLVAGNNTHTNGQHGIAFFGSAGGGHYLSGNRSINNNTRLVGAVNLYMDPTLLTPVRSQLGIAGGQVGFYGVTPVSKAASPGTAVGTDAAVINAISTALRNLGLIT